MEADLCRNLGLDLAQQQQWTESLAYLHRAHDLAEEIQSPNTCLNALYGLARVELARGESSGKAYAHALLTVTKPGQSRWHQANGLYALGRFEQLAGNHATAEELWQRAIFLAHETENRMLLWQLHAALAQIAKLPNLAEVHNRIAAEVIQQIAEPFTDEALKAHFLAADPVAAVLNQLPRKSS